jgi:N-methylhydantoinase A
MRLSGQPTSRISIDVGGTFTDVVHADVDGTLTIGKALTTKARAADGIVEALAVIASDLGSSVEELLSGAGSLLYGTTRATNAVVEGDAARTAFFTTHGFPEILTLREGGKLEPFNYTMRYPEPYIPRHLTFEIEERIGPEGQVIAALDEPSVERAIADAERAGAEAVAVCLLWSVVNPAHEQRVGALIEQHAPGLRYTLSHQLNPIIREYRRASSTAFDASLKPLMQDHLATLDGDLRRLGFRGTLLVATAFGGAWPVADAIAKPIYTIGSGPSLAPTAALSHAELETDARPSEELIVCDTGGTTFDVALVSGGSVTRASEVWLGARFTGFLLGISAVDIKSFGAGGGSIAWVDDDGLLHVGPRSAGSYPGPACYGLGGTAPTVTDAALVLGYLDPARFLGGRMTLDAERAHEAVRTAVAEPLGLDVDAAAAGILAIANEAMVGAIKEMTIDKGADPRTASIVAGGGAAGMNILPIAAELGCAQVMIPKTAGALSAYGGSVADIIEERRVTSFALSSALDIDAVNSLLAGLRADLAAVRDGLGFPLADAQIEFFVEARYPQQVWEITVPLDGDRLDGPDDVEAVVERFHAAHERLYAVRHPGSPIELVGWMARLTATPERHPAAPFDGADRPDAGPVDVQPAYFPGLGRIPTPRYDGGSLRVGQAIGAPAVIEEPTTTVVVHPGSTVRVTAQGYLGDVQAAYSDPEAR